MKKTIILLLTICATGFTYISCSNNEDNKTNQADVNSIGASIAIDATTEMDIKTGLLVSSKTSSTLKSAENISGICGTVTVTQQSADSYPKVFTVDYGTAGCADNQIVKKGKLKITFSGPITTTGSKMTIERIDYSITGIKLEGTIEYVNTTTIATVPQFSRKVTNGKFTDLAGRVYLNSGIVTIKQTAGVSTPFVLDDNIYEMPEGTHTVTAQNGETLTLTVQESLIKKYSCEFISKGRLKVQGGILNGVVDYGDNDCDSKYTYTNENGTSYNLVM
ncbi:hypothetical protein ASF10_17080 [Flavobacterium sp. Leaf82]|uniref:hypothetical protein n=1 Tax=unclassified Flavobacterium TaxID=196869 RepID=UPI0006F1DD6B|nr:hypothetical protein [Flavobacterium sp. Leaf82]KQO20395.1 hypothetical protein ASF10_17080 [Flavobacterium sp. Leaf82]